MDRISVPYAKLAVCATAYDCKKLKGHELPCRISGDTLTKECVHEKRCCKKKKKRQSVLTCNLAVPVLAHEGMKNRIDSGYGGVKVGVNVGFMGAILALQYASFIRCDVDVGNEKIHGPFTRFGVHELRDCSAVA